MKLWLFPIEPLEERYSKQWYEWWPRDLRSNGFDVEIVDGKRLCNCIKYGQFLDAIDTHYYKAHQLADWLRLLHEGAVTDGDIVLLLDGWNPQVEAIAYARDAIGLDIKVAACLHAGTWDPHDFLTQRGLGSWAANIERGWFEVYDKIYVATKFHANLLIEHGCRLEKIAITGFPMYADFVTSSRRLLMQSKKPIVVFPHRLSPEKQPQDFEKIRGVFESKYGKIAEWIRTMDVCSSKEAYYDLLATAKVAVSTALQETWGIAMIESAVLGCYPILPDRLSYRETILNGAFYKEIEEAVDAVYAAITRRMTFSYDISIWERAIDRIAVDLKGLPFNA